MAIWVATWRSGARSFRGRPESDSSCESDFSSEYMLNLWPRGDLGGHVAIWGRAVFEVVLNLTHPASQTF